MSREGLAEEMILNTERGDSSPEKGWPARSEVGAIPPALERAEDRHTLLDHSGTHLCRHRGLAPDSLGCPQLSLSPLMPLQLPCLPIPPSPGSGLQVHPHLPAEGSRGPPPCFFFPALGPAAQEPCRISHLCSEPSPARHPHPCL